MHNTDPQSPATYKRESRHVFYGLSAALGMLTLAACDSSTSIQVLPADTPAAVASPTLAPAQSFTQDVAFQFDFSAQDLGTDNSANKGIKALAQGIMTGTILIENIDTGETETRPWSIEVNDNAFPQATSVSAMPVMEGRYDFTLSVVGGARQYIGTASHVVDPDTNDIVPMILRPVIGSSAVDVTVANSLIDFGFSYPAAQLSAAGLIDPTLVVSVNGGPQQHFALDPVTGLSPDVLLLSLPPGQHQFSMELFDSGYLLGRTLPQQEVVTLIAGSDVTLDIAPQYGSLNFDTFTEGADAPVDVIVPAVVIDEVGGVINLEALLTVVGPNTPFFQMPLPLTANGANYSASIVIPQLAYDDLTYELSFLNNTTGDVIGNCIETHTLNNYGSAINCPINLKRKSVVTGDLLSTLGLNVFGSDGTPLPGAVVRINGVDAGITGGTGLQAANYIELNVKPGQQVISAEFGPESGELVYDSVPLNVTSMSLTMGQSTNTAPALLSDNFDGTQSGSAAPVNYWFGCNGSGTPDFTNDNDGTLGLWSQFRDPAFDYCFGTSAVTERSFTDIEIIDAGGFQVSADIAWAGHPDSNLAIGIGEEAGNDPSNFNPIPSLDAIVDVYEGEIVVRIFDNGSATSVTAYPMPVPTTALTSVTLDVQTDSFAPGTPATLSVYINGNPNYVPPTGFTWDGGSNHIEVRGGSTANTAAFVALDNLTIRPR